VEALASSPRVPGTPAHGRAADYIEQQLKDAGFPCRIVVESDGSRNVIAEAGNPRMPLFVVGAHYDSVPGSPGADDNASGVAALIEVARAYKPYKKPPHMTSEHGAHHVQFVAYDREEEGLLGSAEHCKRLIGKDVVGMVSLEMLGYKAERQKLVDGVDTKRAEGDFLAVVSNPRSAPLLKLFDGLVSDLPVECLTFRVGSEAAMLGGLSDHGSFWLAGHRALLVTDTAFLRNPHYHKPTDTPATLDYTFLCRSAELVSKAISRVAKIA
jgi:Zn-dependent M28 family amino/carboxypeptidase